MPLPAYWKLRDDMLKDLEEELTKMTEDEIKKYHKRAKIKTFAVGSLTALGIIVAAIATDSPLPLVFVPYTCLMGMSTYTPQRDLIKNELNRRNLEYTK